MWNRTTSYKGGLASLESIKRDMLLLLPTAELLGALPQHVVMELLGWETDAMFRCYAIVDERDLQDAVAQFARYRAGERQNGTVVRPGAGQ
jgi:hypothetical protein